VIHPGSAVSFRDPAGFVFTRDGILYRQVNAAFRGDFDLLRSSGLYDSLVERKALVRHDDAALELAASPDAARVIRPERVPLVSYPYEWTFGQLKAAALLTLDVLREALERGMILRDGTAANVQFIGARPVFIDTLSFGRYEDGQPWYGYRQFCEHFLAPLALTARRDGRLVGMLRRFPNGIPLDLASRLLDGWSWLRPGLALHLHAHARAQRKYADADATASTRRLGKPALLRMVEHLRLTVEGLDWHPEGTTWAEYERTHGYTSDAIEVKRALVAGYLARLSPSTVWDLGANTGVFSAVAAEGGARVAAIEGDVAAAERHYRRLAERCDERILPLVVDLLDPTPASGWAHSERQSLEQRGPVDAVLALALVHHLTLGGNVPLARVAEWFARLAGTLLIEWVPETDPQVRRLVQHRPEAPLPYDRTAFDAAFHSHFDVVDSAPVGESGRVLLVMHSRR
jgi:hypothetical protein